MFKVIQSKTGTLEKDLNAVEEAGGNVKVIFDLNKSDDDFLIIAEGMPPPEEK